MIYNFADKRGGKKKKKSEETVVPEEEKKAHLEIVDQKTGETQEKRSLLTQAEAGASEDPDEEAFPDQAPETEAEVSQYGKGKGKKKRGKEKKSPAK